MLGKDIKRERPSLRDLSESIDGGMIGYHSGEAVSQDSLGGPIATLGFWSRKRPSSYGLRASS